MDNKVMKAIQSIAKGWEVEGVKACTECPWSGPARVVLHPDAVRQISLLVENTTGEWLAYLQGRHADETITVSSLKVPAQKASLASVDVYENIRSGDYVGVIHSHHNLGVGFSMTDDEYINANHPLSLLVNNDPSTTVGFRIIGQFRRKVPCGETMIVPVKVQFSQYTLENESSWIEAAKSNIQVKHVVVGDYIGDYIKHDYE